MAQLLLINARDSLQPGQAESEGVFLQERRNVVNKGEIGLFKSLSGLFDKSLHIIISGLEIRFGFLHRTPGADYSIRIMRIIDIDRITSVSPPLYYC